MLCGYANNLNTGGTMELERKAELITERLILKRRVKNLETRLAKLRRKENSRQERRKKFDITSITKVKIDGHWYFKGSDILSCQ